VPTMTIMQARILKYLLNRPGWTRRDEMRDAVGRTKGYSAALGAPTSGPPAPGTLEGMDFVERRDEQRPFAYRIMELGRKALQEYERAHGPMTLKLSQFSAESADDGHETGVYDPHDGDLRAIVERQIRERRGQKKFRDDLRKRYGDRCVVTGCGVLDVLEAAHIMPFRGVDDNHPENGLLLRADIHTLFDLNLLGIEPERLRIELDPSVFGDAIYRSLSGKILSCTPERGPSQAALEKRYVQFCRRRLESLS